MAPEAAAGEGGGGIIVFTLWYIFIAVNYIIAPIFERREKICQCNCRRPCTSISSCSIPTDQSDNSSTPPAVPLPGTGEYVIPVSNIHDEHLVVEDLKYLEEDEENPDKVEKEKEVEDVEVVEPVTIHVEPLVVPNIVQHLKYLEEDEENPAKVEKEKEVEDVEVVEPITSISSTSSPLPDDGGEENRPPVAEGVEE